MKAYHLIGNRLVDSPRTAEVRDKYTGEIIGEAAQATAEQWEEAIAHAEKAYQFFKDYSAERKAEILRALVDGIKAHREELVRTIVREAGKPLGYARNEIKRALDNLKTGIRATMEFTGEQVPMDYLNGKGKTAYTVPVPYGPVLGISPFNFPLNLALHKIIPAVGTGSPVIIKPAPQTPLTMGIIAGILADAGIPEGIIQIVHSDNTLAEKAVRDPRFKILSFTGSDRVGWYLKSISPALKTFLEMGGNAAAVIDATADLSRAAKKLAYGSFLYAGQICISVQRIYVTEDVFDEFTDLFLRETEKIHSGHPASEDTVNGPMIGAAELERIQSWIDEARTQGAQILAGGRPADKEHNIFMPTVLTHTNMNMKIMAEEAFAPVVNINPVKDITEGIEAVNASRYGLQASLYSDSLDHIRRFIKEVEAGGIMINEIPGFRIDGMPYGGMKRSGIGREGARWAMREYTQPKLIVIQ